MTIAATSAATPAPLVHVDERLGSSATWRRYQVRTKPEAASRWCGVSVAVSPCTRTRLKIGTARSPCSPSTHASTAVTGTSSAAAIAVRSRSVSLSV